VAYEIVFKPAAQRDLKNLPPKTQNRLLQGIMVLAENPYSQGVEKLARYDDLFRLRVGDFRVIFEVHEAEVVILIVRIGDRKEIYRLISKK
jgi:mRNA interferase RelE/StbE